MALFNRECELLVGEPGKDGLLIKDLRITFTLKMSHGKSPNEGTFRVYNLSRANMALLNNMTNKVVQFRAGYTGQVGTLFIGDLVRFEEQLDGVDRIALLEVRDSMIAMRDSKTSLYYPAGTSGTTALEAVAANFGLPVKMKVDAADRQLPKGFGFTGRTRNALSELCQYLGLEWSAQQGEIMIINKGATYSDQAVVLSPTSGLIGSPKPVSKTMTDKKAGRAGIAYGQDGVRRYTKTDPNAKIKNRQMYDVDGYSVRGLLNAAIIPGSIVKLISRVTGGEDTNDTKQFFRVEEIEFQGDTHGSDWIFDAELRYPSQGTAPKTTGKEAKK